MIWIYTVPGKLKWHHWQLVNLSRASSAYMCDMNIAIVVPADALAPTELNTNRDERYMFNS